MLVVISCPSCGHLGRVPKGRIGHKVRCKGCGNTFRPDKAMAQPPPEEVSRAGIGRGPNHGPAAKREPAPIREGEGEKPPESGLSGWLKRPTVIDGAIAGAGFSPFRRALVFGVVTGTCIATIIRGSDQFEISDFPWIAFGIVLGAIGGSVWWLLQSWEQAADAPFTSGFQVEEEPPPKAIT